jgi:LysM repeat protein
MHRSGVPASITLAQGILESNYGRSELAVKANNHFGIQCHGDAWEGKSYKAMDSGELRDFRKYNSVLDSYEDHSNFLKKYKRYEPLFKLELTDYKGWARGLKKAGYAEDPEYASKLIRIVEMFELYKYDTMTEVPAAGAKKDKEPKKDKKDKDEKHMESSTVVVAVEKEEPLTERQRRSYRYTLSREMYSQNGVPFIYASAGESYSDIARQYNLFLREVLSFNDVSEDCELPAGAVVYLQAKKRKAAEGFDEYVVEEGMGMMQISQKYAVKLKRLYKMNKVEEDYIPKVGDTIKLR